MAAPVRGRKSHWRATCSEEECAPIGPVESGRLAVAALGPFKFRTYEDADTAPLGDRGESPVCEAFACDQVVRLAQAFRRGLTLSKGAPRRKELLITIDTIEQLSGELARLISGLDDMTIHYIQTTGSGITRYREFVTADVMKEAEVDGLPQVGGDNRTCAWVRRLSALSQYMNLTRAMFLIRKNIESPDEPADKGGNTSLYKEIYGSPRWHLVHEGWHLYDMCKPNQATGHVDGPFHAFLKYVFEFATGLDPEQDSKLTGWLKKLCRANREMKEVMLRRDQLEEELNMLTPTSANKAREEEIYVEYALIDRQHAKLWYEIYPFH
jgi:hypothetical protein